MPIIKRTMQHRQMHGSMFGEDAVLVKNQTTRDRRGRAVVAGTTSNIKVATNPVSSKDARVAVLIEGGTKIEDLREFFTSQAVSPKQRDIIRYNGDDFVIITTADYGGHFESIGSRVPTP